MNYQVDLKAISKNIALPPFNLSWSIVQLHDEISPTTLLQTVFDVASFIDGANKSSIFPLERPLDEKVLKLCDFLRMLRYKPASTNLYIFIDCSELCMSDVMQFHPEALLAILTFLLTEIQAHQKRAYLALYLSVPEIPTEFSHDESNFLLIFALINLAKELEMIQEEFKTIHKLLNGNKQSGPNSFVLKREIQLMEEEKQQLLAKIAKIQSRVKGLSKFDQWIELSQKVRLAQQHENTLDERFQEQKQLIQKAEKKLEIKNEQLNNAKLNLKNANAENVFSKMEEDNKMNGFLAYETLPKVI
jgi:intraflagellar transport protein 81